jgi:hypothetical protein
MTSLVPTLCPSTYLRLQVGVFVHVMRVFSARNGWRQEAKASLVQMRGKSFFLPRQLIVTASHGQFC